MSSVKVRSLLGVLTLSKSDIHLSHVLYVSLVPASQKTIYITDGLLIEFRKIMDKN